MLKMEQEALKFVPLSAIHKSVIASLKNEGVRSIGEALSVIEKYEFLYKGKGSIKNPELWKNIIEFLGFQVCLDYARDTTRLCGFLEARIDLSDCSSDSWKCFRLDQIGENLRLTNNSGKEVTVPSHLYSHSHEYLAIYYGSYIRVFSGLPGLFGEGAIGALKITSTLISMKICQTVIGPLIFMELLEDGKEVKRVVSVEMGTEIKMPQINNGFGYKGVYLEGSLLLYNGEEYPVSLPIETYNASSSGYRDIDMITTWLGETIFYDPSALLCLWSLHGKVAFIDTMVFHKDKVMDMITGRVLLDASGMFGYCREHLITSMTRKEDGTGYIVWINKEVYQA